MNYEKEHIIDQTDTMRLRVRQKRVSEQERKAKEDEYFRHSMSNILASIETLLIQKRDAYGPYNLDIFGELGIVIRASDKLSRIAYLVQHPENEPNEETVTDTWRDIAGYAILALLMREKE